MKSKSQSAEKNVSRRKYLFYAVGLMLFYPLLKFAGFKVPKKPIFIPVHKKVPLNGYILTKDFILFDRDGSCWALSRRCTHLGCRLNYLEEKNILECPCHQSQFEAATGNVINGPARHPLTSMPVEKRDEDPIYIVTS